MPNNNLSFWPTQLVLAGAPDEVTFFSSSSTWMFLSSHNRILVYLVMYDSGQVSLEHLVPPSQRIR